jgi:hypothetical protein
MSDEELRQYFLQPREDKIALQAYLDRLSNHPRTMITTVDDADFDDKIQAIVLRQMRSANSNDNAAV